jgi:hypothetical protein
VNPPGNAAENKNKNNHSANGNIAPPLNGIDRRPFNMLLP